MFSLPRWVLIGVVTLLSLGGGELYAAPDPLRLIPEKTDLIVKIENPKALLEAFTKLDATRQAEKLDPVRQALDTAQVRRFFQLVAYYERDLGHAWPELVDRLAGGGIALGVKYEKGKDDPVLAVIQGTDPALVQKFIEKALGVLEQELSRQDSNVKLTHYTYKNFKIWSFGKGLQFAQFDAAMVISNHENTIKAALDLELADRIDARKPSSSILQLKGPKEARKLLPPNPLMWAWLNLEYLHEQPDAKNLLTTPRDNSFLTFLFAGWFDVVRRADYVTLGMYQTPEGFNLTVRLPAGRQGRAADVVLHLPEDDKSKATLPLLEPTGVIFSHSFYLDLGALWDKRDKIFNQKNAKDFEKGVREASRFLPGASIDKLFQQSGVYHRFVVVEPQKAPYGKEPGLRLPAFAFVTNLRDPAFAKSAELLIKGGAAIAGFQVSFKYFEEKIGDVPVFGYRFPENGTFAADTQNVRFNFVPCFAVVKDQYIACTNMDLMKELIGILQKEDDTPSTKNAQMKFYANGVGRLLNASPEQLLTQTILNQAVPESEAKKQVSALLRYLEQLGTLQLDTDWQPTQFQFNITWKLKK